MPETVTTTGVPPPPPMARFARSQRAREFALAMLAFGWFAVADALAGRAARGLTIRFDLDIAQPLLAALFLVFLLTVGFGFFEAAWSGGSFALRRAAGLPQRPTAGREWALGAAIGWGMAFCAVLPMALGRALHVRFWTEPRAFTLLALNIATLAVLALGIEMGLRGYPFRRLIGAVGAGWATAAMAVALGAWQWFAPAGSGASALVAALFGVLFSLAWLRTHGLWLGWGLRAAWSLSVALLFGLPLRGDGGFGAVVQTRAIRPAWLTGDGFGPDAAALTIVALIAAVVVLVRTSRDYAWDYTRPEIVAAGYAVEPAPPAAHAAMEREAITRPPALVQILPTTPAATSIHKQ